MTHRLVVVPLTVPSWSPPGIDPARWRRALAEDVVDLVATLAAVTPAIAVLPADRRVPTAQDRGELVPQRGRLGRAVVRLARTLLEDRS